MRGVEGLQLMTKRLASVNWLWLLLIGGLLCLSVSVTQAAAREIQPLKEWRGRIEKSLQPAAPAQGFLTNQADLDRLWEAWHIPGAKPVVDFKTQLLLVRTCNCSIIWIAPRLDDRGDLKIQVTVTKDIRPDAAYVMVLIPRQGIRTVEGKPLKVD
jgi:hypothetical protein